MLGAGSIVIQVNIRINSALNGLAGRGGRGYPPSPMNDARRDPDDAAAAGFLRRPGWALVLFALLLAHAATTSTLFDEDRSGRALRDDRPILNGAHPLHQYHGLLGAQSWRDGGYGACYDPAFQAGYPKTPVFDSGSRPAEIFFLIGSDQSNSYKIGLAICCVLVPLVFVAAARLLEHGAGTACVAAGLGIVLWWGGPTQRLLERGQFDWLLAGLNLVLHAAFAVRFHRDGGVVSWLGVGVTAALGWFLHPILWVGFGVLFLPLYVFIATSHGIVWNIAILSAWFAGLVVNIGWLDDWLQHCWMHLPLSTTARDAVQLNLEEWFAADVGGNRADRMLALSLLGGGLLGIAGWLLRGRFAAAFVFGATAILLPALSFGGGLWRPLEVIGLAKFCVLACYFAVVPCAAGVTHLHRLLTWITRHPARGTLVLLLLLGAAGFKVREDLATLARQARQARPLQIGLSGEQQTVVRTLKAATKNDARILWEERPNHPTPAWTALLPSLTSRHYLGGLGPDAEVDHSHARLVATHLAGRPITEWTDAELADFCTRFNVGYVVAWTPEVLTRFRAWSAVEPVVPVHEHGEGWLLSIKRPRSMVLKGKARVIQLDADRIALADVEPEDGVVVLSLHFQEGFRITPSTITAEREPDPEDPIPRLRLKVPSPTLRVTLTWGKP